MASAFEAASGPRSQASVGVVKVCFGRRAVSLGRIEAANSRRSALSRSGRQRRSIGSASVASTSR